MAMESRTPRNAHQTEPVLVKCFVCIVLGINSQQLNKEVEHVLESIEMDVSVKIEKSSKTNCRRTYSLVCGVVVVLAMLGAFLYEYFFPGSALRYWLCRRGSIPGHTLKYPYHDTWNGKVVDVLYIQFGWTELKQKMKVGFPPLRGDDVDYYLNLDVCAYGGTRARTGLQQDTTKRIMGCYVVAANKKCTKVYCYKTCCWSTLGSKHRRRNITCIPQPSSPSTSSLITHNKNHFDRNICNKTNQNCKNL